MVILIVLNTSASRIIYPFTGMGDDSHRVQHQPCLKRSGRHNRLRWCTTSGTPAVISVTQLSAPGAPLRPLSQRPSGVCFRADPSNRARLPPSRLPSLLICDTRTVDCRTFRPLPNLFSHATDPHGARSRLRADRRLHRHSTLRRTIHPPRASRSARSSTLPLPPHPPPKSLYTHPVPSYLPHGQTPERLWGT